MKRKTTDTKEGKGTATHKDKPPGDKKSINKPLSLSCFSFDEVVDIALNTKPKKKGEENRVNNEQEAKKTNG